MTDPVMSDDAAVCSCIGVDQNVARSIQSVDIISENLARRKVFTARNSDDLQVQ